MPTLMTSLMQKIKYVSILQKCNGLRNTSLCHPVTCLLMVDVLQS